MKKAKLVTMALIATAALTACGGTSTEETTTQAATEATEQSEDATEEATTEETTEEETEAETQSESVAVGTPAKLGDWTITVDNVQMLDAVPDGYGEFTPDDGNKYLLVSLTAANDGKEAGRFMPSFGLSDDMSAIVIYGDGYEFVQTQLMGYSKSMTDSTINPLSSKSGDLAFEVPNTVAESTEPIILKVTEGNGEIDFALR